MSIYQLNIDVWIEKVFSKGEAAELVLRSAGRACRGDGSVDGLVVEALDFYRKLHL